MFQSCCNIFRMNPELSNWIIQLFRLIHLTESTWLIFQQLDISRSEFEELDEKKQHIKWSDRNSEIGGKSKLKSRIRHMKSTHEESNHLLQDQLFFSPYLKQSVEPLTDQYSSILKSSSLWLIPTGFTLQRENVQEHTSALFWIISVITNCTWNNETLPDFFCIIACLFLLKRLKKVL